MSIPDGVYEFEFENAVTVLDTFGYYEVLVTT